MPFFLRPQQATPAPQFSPEEDLLAFLSAFDPSSKSHCSPRRHHQQQREQTFTPRFDVLETSAAYELFGEVAGLEKESLSVQWEDAQTLLVKGRVNRPEAATAVVEKEKDKEVEKEKSHHASVEAVEDEYDAVDTPLSTPSIATAESEKQTPAATTTNTKPTSKFWVSERRVGSFTRTFTFSQRLDHDAVSAELKEGVLHLVVPKSEKARKVEVSVF